MRGENDDELNWPFTGAVEVTLLNQVNNNGHFTREIWEPHSAKPIEVNSQPAHNRVRNERGWGPIRFMSLVDVEQITDTKQYLMNDTVYLQVTVTAK